MNGPGSENYKSEVESLFWDWYINTFVELYDRETQIRFNDDAKSRAYRLGISVSHGMNPASELIR